MTLKAGAAKICITPQEEMFPAEYHLGNFKFSGVHDDLFVRALVLDNGERRLAVITFDAADMSRTEDMLDVLSARYGLLRENVLFAATHTHEAPTFANEHHWVAGDPQRLAWVVRYGDFVVAQAAKCVGLALGSMREAKWGYGTGKSYINVNRDQLFESGFWGRGRDFEGPSDKTLGVIKVDDLKGGKIAIVLNYAVHCLCSYTCKDESGEKYLISGDIAGRTSAYIEERYLEDGAVCLWTSGAAGNQEPIYTPVYNKLGQDGSNHLGYSLGYASWDLCAHVSETHAVDAIRIMDGIENMRETMKITVVDRDLALPGRRMEFEIASFGPVMDKPFHGKIEEGSDVVLKLKLITLDDLALLGNNGELYCEIGIRLKQQSPMKDLFVISHISERAGYLPDRRGYDRHTFGFFTTNVMDGCTEDYLLPAVREMYLERLKDND
ncbi:MAG: neutral/alkaline non-lysosomal ceramidase N-terminal domain-containing protein [Clostridiales Family XIII bacterium]|jgi:hypothetical protein|nr:neutral/alkaline non-lysosomal ceramidase N-terminal domain-containing protein [Clostridiales Family XIII bacterium]